MADIAKKESRELTLKRLAQRTAELNYSIARLELRRMELLAEIDNLDGTIAGTQKTLDEHLEFTKNI
jgi:uncharacterized protein with von Willebrand factor type A (vWA) domain